MASEVATGFDRLAPYYWVLTRIVFGKKLEQAQIHFLYFIKPDTHVLILGGGNGNFLKSLLDKYPELAVDYIDISQTMIQLAREKTRNPSNVNFILGTEQNIPNRRYAVVITNFYLDLFSDYTLPGIVQKIKTHLRSDAQWLVTDFVQKKNWHTFMLWIMYRFFRIVTRIESHRLPDWQAGLDKVGFQKVQIKNFYGGFIQSAVYKALIKA